MGEQFEINNNTKEIFPIFDIEWQQLRQKELFSLLENEIVKNQITFDNFNTEQEYFGILKSKTVQGGVELSESTFKIRERGTRF